MEGITPRQQDFPIISFFAMAKAKTETIGCAVKFCQNSYFAVFCYYGEPHVTVGDPLYEEGPPCSDCPKGYECGAVKNLCYKVGDRKLQKDAI
ncbi:hypothetical protein OSTOST_19775 [Ostertagia ostertagi]